jgi:hypothetical protein
MVCLAFKAAPQAIGSMIGFVVGIIASIPETATKLCHVIVSTRLKEVGYVAYEYDEGGRVKFMKMYPPEEHSGTLVGKEFYYTSDSDFPYKTEVTRLVEVKARMIPRDPEDRGALSFRC